MSLVEFPVKNCHFDTRRCTLHPEHRAQAYANPLPGVGTGWEVVCGHCGGTIYEEAMTLVNHTLRCEEQKLTVIARDLGVAVHRCERGTDELVEEAAEMLLASQMVGAASST